jgi:uncharacterized membrane protein YdbT with pleckstrin-like domain
MGYIESNLLTDERIVHKARLHWLIFWKAALAVAAGLVLLAIEPLAGLAVVAFGGVLFVPALVAYTTSEFGVTTKRVIVKVGLVRRRTVELLLRQVEAIAVDQTIMGRIFNYGSITLSGTGGVREVFHNIGAPLEFRRQIQSLTT